ncbi:MAG TPA: hypothetical protein VNQ90_15025 [Chthoniobacteraceae bacterium]|nr:hypothetical protein [Chthoniobacteraceae bacterium]
MNKRFIIPSLLIGISLCTLAAQLPQPTPPRTFPHHDAPRATREPIPDYQPEFEPGDPRIAKAKHRIHNIRDYGAKGDGFSHLLSDEFKDQASIDQRYGPGRYRLDDESDYVAIMEGIRYAKAAANETRARSVRGLPSLYIPQGIYQINRTIPLVDISGFTISGDGKRQTVLRFTGKEEALFGIERSSTLAFEKFEVISTLGTGTTAFLIADVLAKYPDRPTYHFDWTSVSFTQFDVGVKTTGWAMTDSTNFLHCRFNSCGTALLLDNHQSMGHHFQNCYFGFGSQHLGKLKENSYPVVFHVKQGGNITVSGGYIIIHDGTTLLLEPRNEKLSFSPINWSTGLFNFYGVKWEQVRKNHPVLFDAVDDGKFSAKVNFDNCLVYQRTKAEGASLGALHPGMNVSLRNVGVNKNQAYIQEVSSASDRARRASIVFDHVSGIRFNAASTPVHAVEWRGPTPL